MRSLGIHALCDAVLKRSLELSEAPLGNVQLVSRQTELLTIEAQHGFQVEFLRAFETVHPLGASVCARAARSLSTVAIEDVMADPAFKPYREIAEKAGFRAVSSTPMISNGGFVLGVVSLHFPCQHKPSKATVRGMEALARAAAGAMMKACLDEHIRCFSASMRLAEELIETSRQKVQAARKLLDGGTAAISATLPAASVNEHGPEIEDFSN
jgi:GAF domain-containing protein